MGAAVAFDESATKRFRRTRRAGPPRAFVTLALVALNLAIFVAMVTAGVHPFNPDPGMLVDWGGGFGPRTTDGEWWRLVTAMFVHAGAFHLLANMIGLLQVGVIVERFLGNMAFLTVYLMTGLLASLASLWGHPGSASVGASGALFGIFGVWLAVLFAHTELKLTRRDVVRGGLAAFAVYVFAGGFIEQRVDHAAHFVGLVAGLLVGLVIARDLAKARPTLPRLALIAAATATIVGLSVARFPVPADLNAELRHIGSVENRIVDAFNRARAANRAGEMTTAAFSDVIDREVVSEIRALRARLRALNNVPAEHRASAAIVDDYLRLREEAFRLRAEGLRENDAGKIKKGDTRDMTAREVIKKLPGGG
jgi:rhomboid protease GluP